MKKGFTLVELLSVIILLGVLGLIATTTITNAIRENGEKGYEVQIGNIIKGAKDWAHEHVFELPDKEGEYVIVTLGQLQNEGKVNADIRNPKNGQLFDQNMEIKITVTDKDYTYEIVE